MKALSDLAKSVHAARVVIDAKQWNLAVALAARRGIQLLRTDKEDGFVRLFTLTHDGKLSLVRNVEDLDAILGILE
jgi:hypothetical protein